MSDSRPSRRPSLRTIVLVLILLAVVGVVAELMHVSEEERILGREERLDGGVGVDRVEVSVHRGEGPVGMTMDDELSREDGDAAVHLLVPVVMVPEDAGGGGHQGELGLRVGHPEERAVTAKDREGILAGGDREITALRSAQVGEEAGDRRALGLPAGRHRIGGVDGRDRPSEEERGGEDDEADGRQPHRGSLPEGGGGFGGVSIPGLPRGATSRVCLEGLPRGAVP